MKNPTLTFIVLAIVLSNCVLLSAQDIPSVMGGVAGNTNRSDETFINSFSSSNVSGVTNPRLSVYPNRYWDKANNRATPETLDNIVLQSHSAGQDLVFYFIHYLEADGDPGGYDKWFSIGQAFATRFGKNSAWLASQGYTGRGATTFMAFNEPWHNSKNWDPEVFKNCLDGLGDGVHSVNPDFIVAPGGMPTYLLPDRNPLIGAITPLLNDGSLDGLTFHLYNDTRRDRPWRMDYEFNSQAVFDTVKSYWGITADIYYHVTEYMPKADEEIDKARYFLMHTWSHLGVVGNNGQPVTRHIAPYLYTITNADHDQFSMAENDWLWKGNGKGRIYQMVSRLTAGMQFTALDPRGKGEFVLEGNNRKLVVWQNAVGWTDHPGSTFTIDDIPVSTTKLEVFRYDSWIQLHGGHGGIPDPYRSISLSGETSYTVSDLPEEECYMFMLYQGSELNAHPEITITSIQDGQVFKEGESIQVTAGITDTDSRIEEVQFFLDRSFLEKKHAPPYEITLEGLPVGSTEIIVTARDEHGGFNVGTVNVVVEPDGEFIRATDDAHVRGEQNSGINYGQETTVETRANPNKLRDQYEAYFKFDLTELDYGSVDSAYLFLRVNRKGLRTIDVNFVDDDNWDENTLTGDNKPEATIKVSDFDPASDGNWSRVDITSLVNEQLSGDKAISFMLLPQSSGLDTRFYSKESSPFNAAYIELKRISIQVAVTTPEDSAQYAVGSDIVIDVEAIDTLSAITKVEFFEDNNKLGESTEAPYTYTWQSPPAGHYLLTAVATNANGEVKRSKGIFTSVVDPDIIFLEPVEDTYVRSGRHSTENYGNAPELTVKRGGVHFKFETLLKFDLSDISRDVIDARIRLRVLDDDDRSGDPDHTLYVGTDDSWQENVVTWDTKPPSFSEISVTTAPEPDQWIEYDVTDQVKNEAIGDDIISFLLNASNNTSIKYYSRESSPFTVRPQLVITMLPDPPDAPDGLVATTFSDTRIDLSWNDQASNEEGFVVERRLVPDSVFMPVGWVDANTTYYSDTALSCETAYSYRIIAFNAGGISDYSNENEARTRLCPNGQTPFGGVPWSIPGTIEAEDFDEGGEGLAYHDRHPYNIGRAYRPTEGVDIRSVRGSEDEYYVGWTWEDEWLEYTIVVESAGVYDINLEVASWSRRGKFHIEFEGEDKTGLIDVPRTWGWQRWRTVSVNNVDLPVGKQIMRLHIDRGLFNIDNITLESSAASNARQSVRNDLNNIDEQQSQDIAVYPNPTRSTIKIAGVSNADLSVYNTVGQMVIQVSPGAGNEIDLSGLQNGVYYIMIRSEGENVIRRIIKE